MSALSRASEGYRDVFIFVMWLYCSDVHPTGRFYPSSPRVCARLLRKWHRCEEQQRLKNRDEGHDH